MRTLLRLTSLAAVAALGMTACERRLTNANLSCVKPEMTTKEVEAILGSPTRIEATPEAAAALTPPPLDLGAHVGQQDGAAGASGKESSSVVRYIYQQKDKTVALTFVGNRLAPNGISGFFE